MYQNWIDFFVSPQVALWWSHFGRSTWKPAPTTENAGHRTFSNSRRTAYGDNWRITKCLVMRSENPDWSVCSKWIANEHHCLRSINNPSLLCEPDKLYVVKRYWIISVGVLDDLVYSNDIWFGTLPFQWQCDNTCCFSTALHWRHNGHDGVSNHQPHDCLLNRLFRRRSKKIS